MSLITDTLHALLTDAYPGPVYTGTGIQVQVNRYTGTGTGTVYLRECDTGQFTVGQAY